MVATGTCNASTVVGVPPCAAASLFSDVMFMKEFGVSGLMTCCLQENACKPTDIGAVRRITLNIPMYVDKVLREKLIEVTNGAHQMISRMEYLPCACDDRRRSPFGFDGTRVLKSAVTTFTVTRVTTNPNKCFVDVSTNFTVDVALPPEGTASTKDEVLFNDIKHFWQQYVERTVLAASEYLLSIALPRIKRSVEAMYDSAYHDLEEAVCRLSVNRGKVLERPEILRIMEKALDAWSHTRRELKHQEMLNHRLEDDFQGARLVAAAAASAAAAAAAAASESQQKEQEYVGVSAVGKAADLPQPRVSVTSAGRRPTTNIDGGKTISGESAAAETKAVDEGSDIIEHNPFFSPTGGRTLSVHQVDEDEKVLNKEALELAAREARLQDISALIESFVTDKGLVDEVTAHALFTKLDVMRRGYVTEQEVVKVLRQLDPLGVYEDRNGAMKMLAAYREALSVGVYNKQGSEKVDSPHSKGLQSGDDMEQVSLMSQPSTFCSVKGGSGFLPVSDELKSVEGNRATLSAVLRRYCNLKEAMQDDAVRARASEMLHKYAFKVRGRLHYDEFCLMMLHVLKDY